MASKKKHNILIIEGAKTDTATLYKILDLEYNVHNVKNNIQILDVIKKLLPDVILLDIFMAENDGYNILISIKSNEDTKKIPVIILTECICDVEEKELEKGVLLGAIDHISTPFNPTVVKLRIAQTLNQIDTIERLCIIDSLTGISNRLNFDNRLKVAWEQAKRDNIALSIFIIDIDDFKMYNDTYGHLQGDEVLRKVASTIDKSLIRSVDFVARWGGEEFIVLLQDTSLSGALVVAERIRKNIEDILISCADDKTTIVTVSIGVNTHIPTKKSNLHDFINRADQALYKSKAIGKNRVVDWNDMYYNESNW
ncbi:MAG: diguanylate cyclase [Defluviitaleaceae bacterium]|nr:diguanylate cyclase [Defluviitaleaceae bacterium]